MQHQPEQIFFKILPLGSSGVGKTAICIRLREDIFVEDYDPTIESGYRKQFVVDEEPVVPEFVDVYGQEEYLAICIRDSAAIFLVYSITSLASFAEIQEKYHDIILKVKEKEKVPIVLIGNKCDLEAQRAVSRDMGEELAKRYGVPFFETSAKDNINVYESLCELVREIRKIKLLSAPPTKGKKKSDCKLS